MNEELFVNDYLNPLSEKLHKLHKSVYITGDFNFDLLKIDKHNPTAEFFELMLSNFLLPSITKPTKVNANSTTLIDNIFTNNIHPESLSGNLCINLSDGHIPSFLFSKNENQDHIPKKHNYYKRNYKKFNIAQFEAEYDSVDWNTTLELDKNDVDSTMSNFLNKINSILDKHAPIEKMTTREYKQSYKPWVTNSILDMINQKHKLFKLYTKAKKGPIKDTKI